MSNDNPKKPLTIDEQINLLRERNLIINDEDRLKHYLNNISYFHLSSYFKYYQDEETDFFYEDVDFDKILNLYNFDRKLRIEFLDGLEKIEKSIKTRCTYSLAHNEGEFCLHHNQEFKSIVIKITGEVQRSNEVFFDHYKEKNQSCCFPIWMIMEALGLGTVLEIYKKSPRATKKEIADYYGVGPNYLSGYLNNLRVIRNLSAHHSRLWNKKIKIPLKKETDTDYFQYNNKIYDSIIITARLLKIISPNSEWLERVTKLIKDHEINTEKMGFPKNWEEIFSEFIS